VLVSVRNALERAALRRELGRLRSSLDEGLEMVGTSEVMRSLFAQIATVAPTKGRVLISGESGTGKELVANAIHINSRRRAKPFIKVNCAALPETLLEAELFGHERGAFTGAMRQRKGRFELADGGTLFLDEISNLSMTTQAKLLRVLQQREVTPIGGTKATPIDIRLIAATNKGLEEMVEAGTFRDDLYFRLNIIPVDLPPLRDRQGDVTLLINYFMKKFAEEVGKEIKGLTAEARIALENYSFPGNVRELENSIEHATVLAKGDRVEATDLPAIIQTQGGLTLTDRLPTIEEQEKNLLLETLEKCGWVKKEAAQHLGISRTALYDKLKRYQITKPTTH